MRVVEHQSYGPDTPTRKQRMAQQAFGKAFRDEAHTIVIDGVPDAADIRKIAGALVNRQVTQYIFSIGVSQVHPKDDFIRKVGMKIATENMHNFFAELKSFSLGDSGSTMRVCFEIQDLSCKHVGYIYFAIKDGERPRLNGYSSVNKFAIRESKTEA
jgi:hypothetical protein